VIGAVPYGGQVFLQKKIENTASKSYTIEKQKGKFVRVKYGKKEGFAFDAFLQKEPTAPKNISLYVIAASGLRLREKADANSAILAVIPLGDSLKSDGIVGELSNRKENTPKSVFKIENVQGFWQKVIYKNKKGYVFSGFISEHFKPSTCNDSYILLTEGWGCNNIIINSGDYNWLGWYRKGQKCELKTLTKITYKMDNDGDFKTLITSTDRTAKRDTSIYIIGIKKTKTAQLTAGILSGKWCEESVYAYEEGMNNHTQKHFSFNFPNSNWQLSYNVKGIDDNGQSSLVFATKDGKQKQTIRTWDVAKDWSATNSFFVDPIVLWYGDMDNDGKLDFLLNTAGEDETIYTLYLSSAAGKGQYIKEAAWVSSGSCC
jgi:hypothetical protein